MQSLILKNKSALATFVALDCPTLVFLLAVVYARFDTQKLLTAGSAFAVVFLFGLVLRVLNGKKYARRQRVKVQEYSNVTKSAIIYRMHTIVPYLHTLLLPLFLASVWFCHGCVIAEALLYGAMLCSLLRFFVFDNKAIIVAAAPALFYASWFFNSTIDGRTIVLTVVQGVLYCALNRDLTKSLEFSGSVIVAQLMTCGIHLLAGGYVYPLRAELNPFVDIGVNLGYLLIVLVFVLMAENLCYSELCIKHKLANAARVLILIAAVAKFCHWGYNVNYRGHVTPFSALIKLVSNKNALVTLGLWLVLCSMGLGLLFFKSPAPNSDLTRKLSPKSPVITALRKVLHFLVLICSAVAIYFDQQVLLGMVFYIIFVVVTIVELLRFYGFLCEGCNRRITKIYRTFGESPAPRSLVVSHAGLMLACGAPFWLEILQRQSTDYAKAFIGIIIVAFADSLAAIIGSQFRKLEAHEKSIAGSATFFISALIGMVLSFFITTNGNVNWNHIGVSVAVALSSTVVEAECLHTDNFVVSMTAYIAYTNAQNIFRL
ncbi:Phosphatidate cytidylyltransferase domain- containing protein [Babesia divergens]|uniref:dolichol kinase n=1 Tax=Babesia divergens TaxID=32595 RepID=A0AAD9GEW6_BABDI|nr:Phosphatidate cytidylyltransferase domain- containing protein [Babesia divergens]